MPPEKKATLLIKNISQLVTMAGPVPRLGENMKELGLIENAGVAISADEVLYVGKSGEVEGQTTLAESCTVIDAGGAVVTPGLIDPHTHPVFARTREKEFEMRTLGKTYVEIAAAGGGIRSSVRDLRETPVDEIMSKTVKRIDRILSYGVTTCEAKSGYGLSTESEIKQLEIIRDINLKHPIELVPTFLGAHEIPDEYRSRKDEYIDLVINEMIPAVVKNNLAEFCDIFCEKNVFEIDDSRKIMSAAKAAGMKLKFHADELESTGGAELAAELGARSADHLVYISDDGIKALAASGTAAVLLPGTTFYLRGKQYAPAKKMINEGVIVALSTDCNPGSSCTESLPLMITLAALQMNLTAAEAISATTVNAAYAIDRAEKVGQLLAGRQADLVIWDMADYKELPYHYGVNLARTVVKKGKVVVNN